MKERSYHKTINQLAMYWIQEHTHKDSDFIHIEGLVPFYYNMLSSLCLLRSKQKETMLKGQALLEKLLPFYLRGDNCPNFIHEFPSSTSNYATLSILPVLFWILEDFHKTFSPHLLLLLKTTLEKLASDIKIIYQNKEKISPLLFKSFACLKKTSEKGWFINEIDLSWMPNSFNKDISQYLHRPHQLSHLVQAYHILKQQSLWLNQHLQASFHPILNKYCFPHTETVHETKDEKIHFLDSLCYASFGKAPSYYFKPDIAHLQAHLIDPSLVALTPDYPSQPTLFKGAFSSRYAYACIDTQEHDFSSFPQTFYPYQLFTHDLHKNILSACLYAKGSVVSIPTHTQKRTELIIQLPTYTEDSSPNGQHELAFFFPKTTAAIKDNTFSLDEPLLLDMPHLQVSLSFSLLKGKASLFGHFMLGHRPSIKKSQPLQSDDWEISLRTLSRDISTTLKVNIDYNLKE